MTETIQFNPFNRPPRIQEPFSPIEIEVPAPPQPEQERKQPLLMAILPMTSILFMGIFYLGIAASNPSTASRGWIMAIPMLGIGIFTVITSLIVSSYQKHEQKLQHIRQLRDYHRQLDKKESRLVSGNALHRAWLLNNFSSPEDIIRKVQNLELRLWERRPDDLDFMSVRLGVGKTPSLITINPPDPDIPAPEIRRAFGIYTRYRDLIEAPIVVSLQQSRSIGVVGSRSQALSAVYSILAQLVTYHSPDDLNVYLFAPEHRYKNWEWMRWLPHTNGERSGGRPDFMAFGSKSARLLMSAMSKQFDARRSSEEDTQDGPITDGPFSMLVFDGYAEVQDEPGFLRLIREASNLRVASIFICQTLEEVPGDCDAILDIRKGAFRFSVTGGQTPSIKGSADFQNQVAVDNLARKLIPISIRALGQTNRIPSSVTLTQIYEAGRIEDIDLGMRWNRLPQAGLLPYPVNIGSESLIQPLSIDLAENHDGPHGIIAGTTGSGKSELLQTLVTALAIEHHPYFVNFLLIDFKGESTFGVFRKLPHTVGMVSNLDKTGAIRALEAIRAENIRRQQFLARHKVEDITEYHQEISRKGKIPSDWEPLPHLFIIVDEFAQLAKDLPNFLPELVATVRVGRSLGLHLILATQRPAGVVTDEMRANLNFRISLRVQTMDDSRDMLRRPDAALLPPHLPGRAYFQLGDGGTPRLFQAARVGVEYIAKQTEEDTVEQDSVVYLRNQERQEFLSQPKKKTDEEKPDLLSDRLVDYMNRTYTDMQAKHDYQSLDPILLPPLPHIQFTSSEKPLEGEEPKISKDRLALVLGGITLSWKPKEKLWDKVDEKNYLIPVGIVDDLARREQPPLYVNFTRQGGHLLVVGAPGMGKTILLRSLILSAAQCLPPDAIHFYILSFAGKSLDHLKNLPHVGDVIHSGEYERLGRLIRHLQEMMEKRKDLFANKKVDDWFSYNQNCGEEPRIPLLVALIDNFAELRDPSYDADLLELEKLIRDGRAYGIYFVITALQSNALPFKIMNMIDQRFVLYMTDKNEYSMITGKTGLIELDPLPGRGFVNTNPPIQFQIALPVAEKAAESMSNMTEYVDSLVNSMLLPAKAYQLPVEIGILPKRQNLSTILKDSLLTVIKTNGNMPISFGIEGAHLEDFVIDMRHDGPNFLISGPSRSGRTSLLQTMVLSAAYHYSPDELMIVLIDGGQGGLKPLSSLPHVLEWVSDDRGLYFNLACLKKELLHRKEHLGLSENKDEFPHLLFVIDDYDLTRDAYEIKEELLTQLGRHIRQDSKYGFGLWLTTIPSSTGSSDPVLRQIKLMRSGIGLVTGDAVDAVGGRTTASMHRDVLPEGRGYLVLRSGVKLAQFAYPDPESYTLVANRWTGFTQNHWPRPVNPDDPKLAEQVNHPTSDTQSGEDFLVVDDALVQEYLELRKQEGRKPNGNR